MQGCVVSSLWILCHCLAANTQHNAKRIAWSNRGQSSCPAVPVPASMAAAGGSSSRQCKCETAEFRISERHKWLQKGETMACGMCYVLCMYIPNPNWNLTSYAFSKILVLSTFKFLHAMHCLSVFS